MLAATCRHVDDVQYVPKTPQQQDFYHHDFVPSSGDGSTSYARCEYHFHLYCLFVACDIITPATTTSEGIIVLVVVGTLTYITNILSSNTTII